VLADLDPASSHHLFQVGLLLALLGGGVIGVVGIASLLGRAGRTALGSGLVAAGALFCAGFIVMIIVAHWGTV
jgi:hypothetical protein